MQYNASRLCCAQQCFSGGVSDVGASGGVVRARGRNRHARGAGGVSRMPVSDGDGQTAALAQFVADSRWQDIPSAVVHEASRAVLNYAGCAIGGSRSAAVERALRVFDRYSGPRTASLFGRPERVDVFAASCLNAMSANVLTYDDTHVPTVMHPGSSVAPPLFAWAEAHAVSGRDLLHAFILGVEVCCRIGNAVSPWHYSHGYLITSTCGVFGAAAGIGKLLGLSAERIGWALGNAANQASGLVETLPDMAKNLAVGNSARAGLLAALLAEQDFTGGERPLEGRFGFARVMGQAPALARLTAGLGTHWELQANAYKPYPTGVVLHPVIDACLQLRAAHALKAEDVEQIAVRGNPLLGERADRPHPRNGRDASLSVQHACAIAFIEGAAGLRQFTDACVARPAVAALRARVTLEADAAVGVEQAHVGVRLKSGAEFSMHVPHLRGSLQCPLSDAELEAKFIDQAAISAPAIDARRAMDALWQLHARDDAAGVVALLTAPLQ
jgi:2-methylcitrate dehydratase PrpD